MLTKLWVSQNLSALVAKDRGPGDPPPVLAGYTEPSLVFALGADVGISDGRGAAAWGARKGGLALIEDSEGPQFLARLAELQADAAVKDELSGFNYSRGKKVHVTLYRVTGLHDPGAIAALMPCWRGRGSWASPALDKLVKVINIARSLLSIDGEPLGFSRGQASRDRIRVTRMARQKWVLR